MITMMLVLASLGFQLLFLRSGSGGMAVVSDSWLEVVQLGGGLDRYVYIYFSSSGSSQ